MPETTFPDIKVKVVVDDTQLKNAPKAAHVAGTGIAAGAEKGTGGLGKLSGALEKVMGLAGLGGMPMVALKGEQALTSLSSTGISGMTMLGGAALAGAGLIAAGLAESIHKYTELADRVENYKRVVGSSAEESSRMVYAFNALGVGEETATQGMFKLSKAIEMHDAKLKAAGVTVQHAANGNVDLAKTLGNVADAYNAELDPAKKNLLLFDAFGKSGKDMIPILEQGSAALRELEASAGLVFSADDLERVKQMEIHHRQVKQSVEEMVASMVESAIPALDGLSTAYLKGEFVQKKLDQAFKDGTITHIDWARAQLGLGGAAAGLTAKWEAQYDASQKVKGALSAQALAAQELTRKNEELWTSADKVIRQQDAQVHAGFGLERAQIAVSESQGKINTAQENYDAALKKFGPQADETLLALNQLKLANIAQKEEYLAVGAAARKLQEETDQLGGKTKVAALDTEAEIDALQKEADTLAPGAPLRVYLEEYIQKLKTEIPHNVTTKFTNEYVTVGNATVAAFAEGGRPPVGPVFMVGERGPELMQLDQPATVYPHGQGAPATDGGGGGDTYQVSVHAETNADPYRIGAEVGYQVQLLRRTR